MGQESGIALSCGVGRRHGLDPVLLWLWCRLAAVALILPLAWEPLYAMGVALKRQKPKKKKNPGFQLLVINLRNTYVCVCVYIYIYIYIYI